MIKQVFSDGQLCDILMYSPGTALKDGRTDLTAPGCILQVAVFNQKETKTVKPHRHLPVQRNITGTQEALFVVRGKISVRLFGLNNEEIGDYELWEGDAVVFLQGGHEVTLEAGALVYEVKNGPYESVEKDKVYLQ
jgi:hypothetical protein